MISRVVAAVGLAAVACMFGAGGTAASAAPPGEVHGAIGFIFNYERVPNADLVVEKAQTDGSGMRQILPKGAQTGGISPDGKRFYFWQVSVSSGHTNIASSDVNGRQIKRLPPADTYNVNIAPNNKTLGFGQGFSPHDHLAFSDVTGRHVRAIPNTPAGTAPSFFPDSRHLAYMRGVPGVCCRMYVIGIDGRGKRPLAGGALGGWPAVSPDGRLIAMKLARGTPDTPSFRTEVAVQPAGGGAVRHLTAAGTCGTPPSWSPDGAVLFISRCVRQSNGHPKPGSWSIAEIAPDGTGMRILASHLNAVDGLVPIPGPRAAVQSHPAVTPTAAPTSGPTATATTAPSASSGDDSSSRAGPIAAAAVLVAVAGV